MKVCTDACLFGAILPQLNIGKALDIGTGTGLLTLMFAQKNTNCKIDAVEIDADAFEQTEQNIAHSPFKTNIQIYNSDIKNFEANKQYDIIFSNPPFFVNDLKSNDEKRNIALHSSHLSYEDLLLNIVRLLKDDGLFYVLIPFANEKILIDVANKNLLFAKEITRVKQTTSHSFFRSIICLTRMKDYIITEQEIIIKPNNNQYSIEFEKLLKDYYLFL